MNKYIKVYSKVHLHENQHLFADIMKKSIANPSLLNNYKAVYTIKDDELLYFFQFSDIRTAPNFMFDKMTNFDIYYLQSSE